MKYTKQDWLDGKCAIKWEEKKIHKLNNFFEETIKREFNGMFDYYYMSEDRQIERCDETVHLPIVTIDELLNENQTFDIWN